MARAPSRPRPKLGARLVQLRKDAGFSQAELARVVGIPQQNIGYWETTGKAPNSDVLPKMAKALGVRVEDLLGTPTQPRKSGPVGRLQKVFELASTLPRKEQDIVVTFVESLIERQRKAG
jgi:transcriptional regulator with XRE-family HTH domain